MGLRAFLNPEEMKARSEKKRCVRQHMDHVYLVECSAVVVIADVLAPLAAAGMLPHPPQAASLFFLPRPVCAGPRIYRPKYIAHLAGVDLLGE